MAEGLLRLRYGNRFEALSAGTAPGRVHPLAVEAMKELGIDISAAQSTHVSAFVNDAIDYVVTVCSDANRTSPHVRAREMVVHQRFDDPSQVEGTHATRLNAFRTVRDQIDAWIQRFFTAIVERPDERMLDDQSAPRMYS